MLIDNIKQIIDNYLNSKSLTVIEIGTVTDEGVRISDKLLLPFDFLTGNLKKDIVKGDKVRLLRNQGASEYFVLEVVENG